MERYDFVVIGAGPAGDGVARPAARRGLRVALIERDRLGGGCLNYGCDPTKALYRAAEVAHLARRAAEFGVRTGEVTVDFARVMARKDAVIDQIRGDDPFGGIRRDGIDLYLGEARFRSPREIEVGETVIETEKVLIATGTRPALPPIEGIEEAPYLTNVSVMDLAELPRQLVVLGGGPIGCEFAQIFARLGSDVTVVELLPRLLTTEEEEISFALERTLKEEGVRVFTGARASRVTRQDGRWTLIGERAGQELRFPFDRLLVATGRAPNTEALNLPAAGVEANRKGIATDDELRTTAEHIWAAGDVVGPYLFTHIAHYHAQVAFANAIEGEHRKLDYAVVPWVIFTDPEVAHVGLTEAQAREQGHDVVTARFDFRELDRAITAGEAHGLGKIVADAKTGRVLGGHYLAYGAGEIIAEVALAMKAGLHVREIGQTIHAYPTMAQGVRWTATNFRFD